MTPRPFVCVQRSKRDLELSERSGWCRVNHDKADMEGLKDVSVGYNLHTDQSEIAISGYLLKKTREGRWQKRWFETNSVYLTYYKSKKMEKLLAALSLPQVGEIRKVDASQDPDGLPGLFSIELNARVYTLRAKSDEEAVVWADTLNKLRNSGISQQERPSEFDIKSQSTSAQSTSGITRESASSTSQADWMKSSKKWCTCFG